MLKTKSQLYQNQCGCGICVKCDRVHHTLLTSKSDCQEDTRRRQISSLSPGSCWSRQVPRSGHAVILTAVTGDTHTHTVRHCSSDCGCYNNETLSLSLSLSRSPVLSSMNVQHIGVCVFALYWNVTRWVAGFFPHNSKAVDTGHLGRRLSTTQPGEKPTHLVRQVIWDRQKGRGTGGERWLSRAVIYFWKKLWAW